MFLSLETLISIIRAGLPILVDLADLVNSLIIFLSQTTLLRCLTFLLVSQTVILTVLLFWIYLFLFEASICSALAFPPLGNSYHVFVSVSIDFPSYSQWDAPFRRIAYDYSRADREVFVNIWEIFHGRISLNSVFQLLPVNFVGGFRWELVCISLIKNIRSNLTHLHNFQLLVLLPWFIEITFFVCTKRLNLLILK